MTPEKLRTWALDNRDLAMTVCKAMAFAQVERERVDAYVVPIFLRYAFKDADDGTPLTDPRRLYLSDEDARAAAFYAECDVAHRAHGVRGSGGLLPGARGRGAPTRGGTTPP